MQTRTKTMMPYRGRRLAAAIVGCVAGLLLVMVSPAWASHTVAWGIGAQDGPRTTTSDAPVEFVVQVTLDGEPMADWPMTGRVSDANGELVEEIPFSTDATGRGTFTVEPGPAGQIVEVCDDDGCVYGEATIEPAADDGASSEAEGDDAPTGTDDAEAEADDGGTTGSDDTIDAQGDEATTAVSDEPDDSSSSLLWILLAVIVVAVVVGGVIARSRSTD